MELLEWDAIACLVSWTVWFGAIAIRGGQDDNER